MSVNILRALAQPPRRRQVLLPRQDYAAPVNEPERVSALHGLATDQVWKVLAATGSEVTLGFRVEPGPAFPSQLDLTATYALSADGLHCSVQAINTVDAAAPYGVCPHPYLVAGPSPLDDWSIEIPAGEFL